MGRPELIRAYMKVYKLRAGIVAWTEKHMKKTVPHYSVLGKKIKEQSWQRKGLGCVTISSQKSIQSFQTYFFWRHWSIPLMPLSPKTARRDPKDPSLLGPQCLDRGPRRKPLSIQAVSPEKLLRDGAPLTSIPWDYKTTIAEETYKTALFRVCAL
jgi:hypothetical protein